MAPTLRKTRCCSAGSQQQSLYPRPCAQHLQSREIMMSQTNHIVKQHYDEHAKVLPDLKVGDSVLCQNTCTNKWKKLGMITEVYDHRQYLVEMIGSGRVSLRNRKHLRKRCIVPPITYAISTGNDVTPPATADVSHETASSQSDVLENASRSTVPLVQNDFNEADTGVNIRRSTRHRQRPLRYRDEQLSE